MLSHDKRLFSYQLKSGRTINIKSNSGPISVLLPPMPHAAHQWPPKIYGIGAVLTNRCNAACAHCYNHSSIHGTAELCVESVLGLVAFLKDDGQPLKAVGLTGGEPFLYSRLNELIGSLRDQNLRVSCTTGGVGLSLRHIRSAAAHGLAALAISWDSFHKRFLEAPELTKLVEYAITCFPDVQINICENNQDKSMHQIEFLDSFLPPEVPFQIQPLTHVGRARTSIKLPTQCGPAFDSCADEFRTIAINFDGKVYACCSVGGFTPGLELLEVDKLNNFSNVAAWYEGNMLLEKLALQGWKDSLGDGAVARKKCELCYTTLRQR